MASAPASRFFPLYEILLPPPSRSAIFDEPSPPKSCVPFLRPFPFLVGKGWGRFYRLPRTFFFQLSGRSTCGSFWRHIFSGLCEESLIFLTERRENWNALFFLAKKDLRRGRVLFPRLLIPQRWSRRFSALHLSSERTWPSVSVLAA